MVCFKINENDDALVLHTAFIVLKLFILSDQGISSITYSISLKTVQCLWTFLKAALAYLSLQHRIMSMVF